jgi:hypothetical protein
MDSVNNVTGNGTEVEVDDLAQLRESIALVQVLELNEHTRAYEEIHAKLEEALKSIDGK